MQSFKVRWARLKERNCPDPSFPHFLDGSSIFQIQNCFAGGFRIAEDGMRRA
jgi:hypothetical protein